MWSLILIPLLAFIWFLPFVLVATSARTSGKEKILWLLALLCISWFAWIIYALFAPVLPVRERY